MNNSNIIQFNIIDDSDYDDNDDDHPQNIKNEEKSFSEEKILEENLQEQEQEQNQSSSSTAFNLQPSTSTSTSSAPTSLFTSSLNPLASTPSTNDLINFDEPIIHNIVSTANFCCKLDLAHIVVRVRNAEYNPKRFRAVIMRIFEPRTTAMIFSSGKIVCTGAKSERLACLASRKYARIIQKLGYEVKFTEFKVQNIVSTVDIKFPIRLDKLSIVHSQFCTYDPDFFPALIYRMVRPRTVLLIFVSGKIIITGAKTRQEIQDTIKHLAPVLYNFRKQ